MTILPIVKTVDLFYVVGKVLNFTMLLLVRRTRRTVPTTRLRYIYHFFVIKSNTLFQRTWYILTKKR